MKMLSTVLLNLSLTSTLVFLAACKGDVEPSCANFRRDCVYPDRSNSTMTATEFVKNINWNTRALPHTDAHGESIPESYASLIRSPADAARTNVAGETAWFVIWDNADQNYKAVSLDFIRSIKFTSTSHYYENPGCNSIDCGQRESDSEESFYAAFRSQSASANSYEVVDYDAITGLYRGTISGFDYEDETGTHDVSLMAAEREELAFAQKAANLSIAYQLNIQASASLVSLAERTQANLQRNNGELTQADNLALTNAVVSIAGVTSADIVKASVSKKSEKALLEKVAKNIGTSASNLENRILPELLNIEL